MIDVVKKKLALNLSSEMNSEGTLKSSLDEYEKFIQIDLNGLKELLD